MLAQFFERDHALQAPFELHVDHKPARIVARGARIVVLALLFELRGIRIRGAYDLDDARDADEEILIAIVLIAGIFGFKIWRRRRRAAMGIAPPP